MKTIGVVGCGQMGSGVAQICAQAGYKTVIVEMNDELLDKGLARIKKAVEKAVEKKKLTKVDADKLHGNIKSGTSLDELKDCDLIIEAITEKVEEKKKLFSTLDRMVKPERILATNTSSVCVIELAAVTKRPEKVLGLHFFNPVPVMKLVEVVKTISTSEKVVAEGRKFVRSLNKEPVACPDTTAFVVNKLLIPYLLDAVRMFEGGQVTKEDIDKAMQLGCGYPMGPLTLLDFVGIDTTYYIANIMFDEFKDSKYAAPPLMKRMVLAGHWGKKTGKGFYEYKQSGAR
jgi:3-hydroxybutyryl-CoA dehydrogenase